MKRIYCVLQIKDKQYFVTEGDLIKTHPLESPSEVKILLLKDKKDLLLGDPVVNSGGVEITILGDKKIKTKVRRYKSKSRYRKDKSHSQKFTFFKVTKISSTVKGVIFKTKSKEESLLSAKVKKETDDLSEMNLSSRIMKVLEKNKIKNANQLSKLSKSEIIALEGLGNKSAEEIIKKLRK